MERVQKYGQRYWDTYQEAALVQRPDIGRHIVVVVVLVAFDRLGHLLQEQNHSVADSGLGEDGVVLDDGQQLVVEVDVGLVQHVHLHAGRLAGSLQGVGRARKMKPGESGAE